MQLDTVRRLSEEWQTKSENLERALEELERTQDMLVSRRKVSELGSLAAGLAHELRTPLSLRSLSAESGSLASGSVGSPNAKTFYQWVSRAPSMPGESVGQTTRHTKTLVEAKGLRVLWLLLIPVLFWSVAPLVIALGYAGQARHSMLLWTPALAISAFCAVGIFSIGLSVPAALALLVVAIADSLKSNAEVERRESDYRRANGPSTYGHVERGQRTLTPNSSERKG